MRRIAAWSLAIALAQRRVLPSQPVGTVHPSILPGPARATGFESACRTRCAGPNQGPESGPRRDAPVPMTAAHGVSGEESIPKYTIKPLK